MMNYWIDKKSVFGYGKNRISYGDQMPKDMDKERLEKLKAAGKVGEKPLDAVKKPALKTKKETDSEVG